MSADRARPAATLLTLLDRGSNAGRLPEEGRRERAAAGARGQRGRRSSRGRSRAGWSLRVSWFRARTSPSSRRSTAIVSRRCWPTSASRWPPASRWPGSTTRSLRAQLAQQTALARQQSVLADEADAQARRVERTGQRGAALARTDRHPALRRPLRARAGRGAGRRGPRSSDPRGADDDSRAARRPGHRAQRPPGRSQRRGLDAALPHRPGRPGRAGRRRRRGRAGQAAARRRRRGEPRPTGRSSTASCAWSAPAVDPTTKLGKVRISLPVRADILAGGFARATFVGGERADARRAGDARSAMTPTAPRSWWWMPTTG